MSVGRSFGWSVFHHFLKNVPLLVIFIVVGIQQAVNLAEDLNLQTFKKTKLHELEKQLYNPAVKVRQYSYCNYFARLCICSCIASWTTYWKCDFSLNPHVRWFHGWSVGRSVFLSVIIPQEGGKFHFHALVHSLLYTFIYFLRKFTRQ